jgi:prepilin-type N-terminal cleavage/methylation domain-containing protein
MIESIRELNKRRSAESESGFTLIELLIVIVVLGILAAIVVFALSGVTGQSVTAACQSDGKTVGIAVGALEAENPTAYQAWASATWGGPTAAPVGNLVSTASGLNGAPFLQSWPTGNATSYSITVAGKGIAQGDAGVALTGDAVVPSIGDVIVTATKSGKLYDATVNPVTSCSIANLS